MRTAGYDFVAEINKSFLNTALAKAYQDLDLETQGSVDLPNLPPELSRFGKVYYKLVLKSPPTLDFIESDMKINLEVEASLQVLEGLNLEIEIISSADVTPQYDTSIHFFFIDLRNLNLNKIEIIGLITPSDLPKELIDEINKVIRDKFLNKVVGFHIPSFPFKLPKVPIEDKMKITLGAIKLVNSNLVAVALNFFENKGGDPDQLADFNGGQGICFGISSDAMHQISEFWWNHTTHSKDISFECHKDLSPNTITEDVLKGIGLFEKYTTLLATGGLGDLEIDVDSASITMNARVRLDNMPNFELKENEKIELSFSFFIDLIVALNINITKKITAAGIVVSSDSGSYPIDLPHISNHRLTANNLGVQVTVTQDTSTQSSDSSCRVISNTQENSSPQNNNSLPMKWLDVEKIQAPEIDLPGLPQLPREAFDWILTKIGEHIVKVIRPFPLSPGLISETIPDNWVLTNIRGELVKIIPSPLSSGLIVEKTSDAPFIFTIEVNSLNSSEVDAIACVNISIQ